MCGESVLSVMLDQVFKSGATCGDQRWRRGGGTCSKQIGGFALWLRGPSLQSDAH